MSVTKTTSIIFGLDVSNLDFIGLDENELYEEFSPYENKEFVYISGDGDDYFGIVIDSAAEGSYDTEHLSTWKFSDIFAAVSEEQRTRLEKFVDGQFAEPEGGFDLDFMITVTYS